MGDDNIVSTDALEDIAYLARSANRLTLLEALTTGAYTRRDLDELTGIARTTIGRIVSEFEERGWVERTVDGEYTATPMGIQVAAEFMPLVDAIAGIRNLGNLVAWLQAAEQSIDLHHFSDATVRRPESTDPMAPTTCYADGLRTADEFHCLVAVAPPVSVEIIMREEVVEGDLTVEHVISGSEFAYLDDHPERLSRWYDYIDAGANVYLYDSVVPCNLVILDETVYIAKSHGKYGEPCTLIESDNDVVRSWAREIIETHKSGSERLDAEEFIS